jgi:hypothetical protein
MTEAKVLRTHLISTHSNLVELMQELTNVVEDSQLDEGAIVSCLISLGAIQLICRKTGDKWKKATVPGKTGDIELGATKVVWVKY